MMDVDATAPDVRPPYRGVDDEKEDEMYRPNTSTSYRQPQQQALHQDQSGINHAYHHQRNDPAYQSGDNISVQRSGGAQHLHTARDATKNDPWRGTTAHQLQPNKQEAYHGYQHSQQQNNQPYHHHHHQQQQQQQSYQSYNRDDSRLNPKLKEHVPLHSDNIKNDIINHSAFDHPVVGSEHTAKPIESKSLTQSDNSEASLLLPPNTPLMLPGEIEMRKGLQILAVHGMYQVENTHQRNMWFSKSRLGLQSLHVSYYDAIPRIVSNDITYNTWSRSIQCLLSTQHCDVIYTLASTLCYYYRILPIINRNKKTVIVVEGKEMTLDSPLAKNSFFIACHMLSMKYNDDHHLSNKYISQVYKTSVTYLNEMEVLAFRFLGFALAIPDAVLGQMLLDLSTCIE